MSEKDLTPEVKPLDLDKLVKGLTVTDVSKEGKPFTRAAKAADVVGSRAIDDKTASLVLIDGQRIEVKQ